MSCTLEGCERASQSSDCRSGQSVLPQFSRSVVHNLSALVRRVLKQQWQTAPFVAIAAFSARSVAAASTFRILRLRSRATFVLKCDYNCRTLYEEVDPPKKLIHIPRGETTNANLTPATSVQTEKKTKDNVTAGVQPRVLETIAKNGRCDP
ncbi:hypothetical protein QR680_002902 [Steinernema hermaphroditum]|uniref:Uncharacterized protein n=1 Tax=Steinernema hermaphroditum TaxID=289476 RepID=A0AA39H4M4_9BILA|nr:hypothetical protein QR680_002902 [Steinernema hermaphroditum]